MAVCNLGLTVCTVFMIAMLSSKLFNQMLKRMHRLIQYRKRYGNKYKEVRYEQAFFHSEQM